MDALIAWKGAAVGLWFVALFVAERVLPSAPRPGGQGRWGWRRLVRNAALFAVTALASPLLVLPLSLMAAEFGPAWRPDAWSGAWALVIDLLILDFWIYWWHRANHEIPFLWRFHQVHHLDRFLDTTSATRFHIGEVLASAVVRAGIIAVLDIPIVHILVFEALVLIAALFHHANLRLPARLERGLSAVIVTPSIHWVHHRRYRRDTDSNYATILSVWDRLFGSRSPTPRTPDMPIGVEGREEGGIRSLLLKPFAKRA